MQHNTTPVPAAEMGVFAVGWVQAAIVEAFGTSDVAAISVVTNEPEMVILGATVYGRAVSIVINATP